MFPERFDCTDAFGSDGSTRCPTTIVEWSSFETGFDRIVIPNTAGEWCAEPTGNPSSADADSTCPGSGIGVQLSGIARSGEGTGTDMDGPQLPGYGRRSVGWPQ